MRDTREALLPDLFSKCFPIQSVFLPRVQSHHPDISTHPESPQKRLAKARGFSGLLFQMRNEPPRWSMAFHHADALEAATETQTISLAPERSILHTKMESDAHARPCSITVQRLWSIFQILQEC